MWVYFEKGALSSGKPFAVSRLIALLKLEIAKLHFKRLNHVVYIAHLHGPIYDKCFLPWQEGYHCNAGYNLLAPGQQKRPARSLRIPGAVTKPHMS